ncbi:Lrp/AsnC family transcriptional regulator [Thermococcus waiotapuensis]|uniref:Lrp/AsnC family transcriptional regulator n=1 Tax=Thermococcus waiotapuensis TaxID=90909 RepID=A0AAE4NSZ0_9EURY|nr:Lrp/AsnC family transcriptional regulator [Thermococcus waiotapuensis]MDV3103768.1 Lrp/AsnC family transcriptional regulator [Thermococcus waiotapuensis]
MPGEEFSQSEMEFLIGILEKYPTESLKKIAELEGIDYYRLKRLYDKYYGTKFTVNPVYDIKKLGLRSFVAFLSVPREDLFEVADRMRANPFIVYVNAMFGFKNGISAILYIPKDQVDLVDDLLAKYSEDYEYYEMRSYLHYSGDDNFGDWYLSYPYAQLMDLHFWDARRPISEIAKTLGKSRSTVNYMLDRLKKEKIILEYIAVVDAPAYDRGVLGLTRVFNDEVLEKFEEYEIQVGFSPRDGWYLIEWYFSSKEDLASKIMEFSKYVEKLGIEYFDVLNPIMEKYREWRFSGMVRKDGRGYRCILDF